MKTRLTAETTNANNRKGAASDEPQDWAFDVRLGNAFTNLSTPPNDPNPAFADTSPGSRSATAIVTFNSDNAENSPAIYGWVNRPIKIKSPVRDERMVAIRKHLPSLGT